MTSGLDTEKGGSTPTQFSLNGADDVSSRANLPKHQDVAAEFLANLDPAIAAAPITPEESRKLLWKIDLIMIPLIMGTVVLAAVDKVIISNAAIYGMKEDTQLVGNQFSWVGSIFYFGYLLFEYPSALLVQRFPVAKGLAAAVFTLAALMLCSAATQNFAGLASVRFIMGMCEAIFFPACSILTVMWWTTKEQPIRVAFWFNQSSYHSPVKCWYMTDREKYICLERVKGNNTGIEDKTIKWYQVKECLLDPKTWLLAVFSLAQNIPNGGLVTFAAIIVSGLGYSPLITTVLGIPTGVLATVWQLLLSFLVSRCKNARCIIIATANIVPMACAILMWKLPRSNQQGLLAAYYVFYTYWAPYVLSTSLPMANTSGHSKKVTLNAIYFTAYCVGNIIGPQLFREEYAPTYSKGYEGLLACVVIASASILAYGFLCRTENRKRDREQSVDSSDLAAETAFSDLTDKEKRSFRYTY
ncbi:hypothetical protein FQN50_005925 [Emmonsiellopsis sp. PD_5]|nr:hypothetical protein FQN50_005925 [Emmonsiellopsis sp. PD_5]